MDIDGVLADFEAEFCERFFSGNRHLSNLHRRYPTIDKDIIDEFVNTPETYERLLPIFGGLLLLRQARALGFYILLMTSRPKYLAEVTRNWLDGYEVSYHELQYAQNKATAIGEYNLMYPNCPIKVLVDDIIGNLENLPVGVAGVIWEQPWNTGYYPRATYDEQLMKIMVQPNSVSVWKPFWENEDGLSNS